jgi:CRISPR-associated endoribonuclease Cas6
MGDVVMLHAILVKLRMPDGHAAPPTRGHQAHGLFLRIVQQADPGLAQRLHDDQGRKPFTVGGVRPPTGPPREDVTWLRVTLLDDALLGPFLDRFLRPGQILLRIGSADLAVEEVICSPARSALAGSTEYAALQEDALPRTEIAFHFASPTAFHLGGETRRMALVPEPKLVFGDLCRKWNLWAPERLHFAPERFWTIDDHCLLTGYRLETITFEFPRHTQVGFVGSCRYRFLTEDAAFLRQANTLAAFALYAGVGHKTTMGMGQVRPLLARQDRIRAA